MKWQKLIIIIIAILLVPIAYFMLIPDDGWYVDSNKIGTINHKLIVTYTDGTTSDSPALTILYRDKPIQSIQYSISAESYDPGYINPLSYSPAIQTPFGTHTPSPCDGTTTATSFDLLYNVSMWKLANYSLDDGTYNLNIHPSGSITYNSQNTNLPPDIPFSLTIKDDRTLNLVFG